MAFVVVEEKGQQILRRELQGPAMSIGRDESNDLRLENRALSRKHAQLELRGSTVWIRDLGSQNGTFINGERLDGARAIRSGDQVSLGGKFELRLEGMEEPKSATPVLTLTGPEGSHRFAMVGEEIVIGRSPDCDISIGRKSISRRHLRVVLKDGTFFAEDLGSQNGTRVNGERIRGMTPVTPDDEVRVSEYTIKVGYLDPSADGVEPARSSSRNPALEKGKLGSAADLGGDLGLQLTGENRALVPAEPAKSGASGTVRPPEWEEGDERVETVGYSTSLGPKNSGSMKPPALPKGPARPAASPAPAPAKAPAAKEPSLEVNHADGARRTVRLKRDALFLAEDGSADPPPPGVAYPPVGYLAFVPTPQGWVALAVGDRRFPLLGGQAAPVHALKDGDEVELGGLRVTFRDA